MADVPGDSVEVVYAKPERQRIVRVPYEPGLTAERAVQLSGLAAEFPEIHGQPLVLGVFGVRVRRRHLLRSGDRVEICRPLERDPRDRRRDLAVRKAARE